MTAIINWQIDYLNTSTQVIEGHSEVVVSAGYRCNGQEDTASTSVYGSVSFLPPQPNDPNFTPYDQLTKEQVLTWVWASGVDKDATELAVQTQLTSILNPPVEQLPLPWNNSAII